MGVKCLSYSRETWLWTGHRPLSVLARRYRTVTKCPVRQLSTKQHAGRPRIAGYMGTKVSPNSLYLVGKGTSPHCFIIWTLNYVYNLIVMVNTVICMKNEKCPSEVSGTGIFGPRLVSLFGGCIGSVFLLENIHHWAWDSSQLFLLCDFYKGYEFSDSMLPFLTLLFQDGSCPWNHEIYKLLLLEITVLIDLYQSSRKWQIWHMGGGECPQDMKTPNDQKEGSKTYFWPLWSGLKGP